MSVSQKEEAENVVAKQQPDEEHEHSSNENGNGDAHATKLTEESGENGGDDTADGKAADGGGEEQDQAIPVSDDEETEETVQQPVDAGQQFQMQEGFYQQEIGDSFAPATVEPEELDEISIAREISSYIDVNRVNFGEIDSIEELWGLCDAISAAHSGLPDSLLKEAFHLVLEGHYGRTKNHWLRTHIEKLLRMWKKEMLKHKSTPRPTKFVASATYETAAEADVEKQQEEQPKAAGEDGASAQDQGGEQLKQLAQQQQPTEGGDASAQPQSSGDWAKLRRQRKQENKRKRALAVIMGVGQMLDHARKKFATEDGELDIEEDEYGNFSIGGMELSFEAWGQINKIKADDVVHSDVHVPAKRWKGSAKRIQNGASAATEAETKQLGANAPQPPSFSVDTPPTSASASGPSMAEQYPTVGEVEMPGLMTATKPKGKLDRKKAKLVEKKQRKADKDEGEISSSSESDEQSSSSSEESDGEKGGKSKHKKKVVLSQAQVPAARARDQRKARREEERQHGASSAQNLQVLLRKCFDLRGRIARKLSVQQKAMFMDVIRQSIAGTLQQQSGQNQHQALTQLMGAFARQSS